MNHLIRHLFSLLFIPFCCFSQVQFQMGPSLETVGKSKMNRMIGTDGDGFYCYRVSAKGNYAHLIIEKFDKASMKPMFSREIKLNEQDLTVEEVKCVGNSVFVFITQFDKKKKKSVVSLWKVSGTGKLDSAATDIISFPSDNVYYDVVGNPSQSKFLIKACYKVKDDLPWATDFSLFDVDQKKVVWTKTIEEKLRNYKVAAFGMHKEEITFAGLFLDDQDNVFYAQFQELPTFGSNVKKEKLTLAMIKNDYKIPKLIDLDFLECRPRDIGFVKINNDQLLIAGFTSGYIEKGGEYFKKAGVFSCKINIPNNSIDSKTVEYFDNKLMTALEYNSGGSDYYTYKLDHILLANNSLYFVGQQYYENFKSSAGSAINSFRYQYMDILVAKQGNNGKIEWIRNIPFRKDMIETRQEALEQYVVAIGTHDIYLLHNENPANEKIALKPNLEPGEFKSLTSIHGSNFVCTVIDGESGKTLKRILLSKNEEYCFQPVKSKVGKLTPPSAGDIFTVEKGYSYLFLEDGKKYFRFAKVKFD